VKQISWNNEKNAKLKRERGIGFEDVLVKINNGDVLDIMDNPNKRKYPNHKVFIWRLTNIFTMCRSSKMKMKFFLKQLFPAENWVKNIWEE